MTGSEGQRLDQPFPGAQPQVRGARRDDDAEPRAGDPGRPVRLEARMERQDTRWVVRLPVRSEFVTPRKETVVYERVVVARRLLSEVERLEGTIRREELTVEEHPARE